MKSPKTLYILIAIFCLFALIAGIYVQFFEKGNTMANSQENLNQTEQPSSEKDAQIIKNEFQNLFTNTINLNGYDSANISKINVDKEIVYTAYDIIKNEEAYEVNMKIPVVNIKSDVASSFNSITQTIFVNKANEILKKTDTTSKTIYSIDYVGYVNGDILSVAIKSTLKEGQNPQRVMIQTYNYNLRTNTKITLSEIFAEKGLDRQEVSNKIKEVVQEADAQSKAIQDMGYNNIFSRDLTSSIYTIENSGTFLLGEDGKLYIIYAYGNQNFTSEMDIVLFE